MKGNVRLYGPLIILAVTYGVFAAQSSYFFSVSNAVNILDQAAPLVIATLGQALVLMTGGFDISVGSTAALSSVVIAMVGQFGMAAGLLAAVVIGATLGAVNGTLVSYLRVQPVVATLGMLMFARGAALLVSDGDPILGLPSSFVQLAYGMIGPLPAPILVAVLLVVLLELFLVFTPMGRAILSLGGSAQAAHLNGVKVAFNRFMAYTLCGTLVALAAVLYTAKANSGQPTLGSGLELQTIAAAVIGGVALRGGVGRIWSATVGALVIATLSNGMNLVGVTPFMQEVVTGLTLLLAVLLQPKGSKSQRMLGASRLQKLVNRNRPGQSKPVG